MGSELLKVMTYNVEKALLAGGLDQVKLGVGVGISGASAGSNVEGSREVVSQDGCANKI